ncbi:MAG: carboxymuconolactone decarboxylase family protein [Chlorobiaceae bacterium]
MSIRYIASQPAAENTLSATVLQQIRREFGAEVEPFTLHQPLPELLAGVWMACRESLLAGSGRRDAKELIAATISALNGCPYCVDAHSIMFLHSSEDRNADSILASISEGLPARIEDPFLQSIASWAQATRTPGAPVLSSPPFSLEEAPAYIGTAVIFHYINRMVTILLGASPLPFTRGLPKKLSMQVAAWFFGSAIRLEKEPGTSLMLLQEAELPDDLLWAKPSPNVSGAFARLARAVEQAGSSALSSEVRLVVTRAVASWNGIDPEISSGWYEEATQGLGATDKIAAKLALLTALAPYRVDEPIVNAFTAAFPGDAKLLSLLAWSSFTAARKIGTWL